MDVEQRGVRLDARGGFGPVVGPGFAAEEPTRRGVHATTIRELPVSLAELGTQMFALEGERQKESAPVTQAVPVSKSLLRRLHCSAEGVAGGRSRQATTRPVTVQNMIS